MPVTLEINHGDGTFERLAEKVEDLRGLMETVGQEGRILFQEHFREKNQTPNKLGGARTNFWNEIADHTALTAFDESSAELTIADRRFLTHFYGNPDLRPVEKEMLAIPIHSLSHGLRAGSSSDSRFSSFTETTGIKLFRPGRKDDPKNVLAGLVEGRLEFFYALRESVEIPKDEDALPTDEEIRESMTGAARDWLELGEGGSNA